MRNLRLNLPLFLTSLVGLVVFELRTTFADDKGLSAVAQQAMADPDFELQGEYEAKDVGIQVIAEGSGDFVVVKYTGGLPGAGWNRKPLQREEFTRDSLKQFLTGQNAKKVNRKSPTLGAKAPAGATILFDGSEACFKQHWKPGAKIEEIGNSQHLLKQGATSVDQFQDCLVHIEFQLPFEPSKRGQGRGNSGIYLQGRYEVQMLDSFGLEGKDNECGGIYTVKAPDLNMCYPPVSWQTYDIEFTAARFDPAGKRIQPAKMTVRHNGTVIHTNVVVDHATTASPNKEGATPGPIYLQDHGNQVRYRNIWVQPIDAAALSRRPFVAGFERFANLSRDDKNLPGKLLANELGCVKCHASDSMLAVKPKEPPKLNDVGLRLKPDFVKSFIVDPAIAKPGTTMPNVWASVPKADRAAIADEITHFLVGQNAPKPRVVSRVSAADGERLFHQIGCVACHAPRTIPERVTSPSVPLADLATKYTQGSFASFLLDPLHARPSGRMPRLVNDQREADAIAVYLIPNAPGDSGPTNFKYELYHGKFDRVPDFKTLKPKRTGECRGLDLTTVPLRSQSYAVRFTGTIMLNAAGQYTFHLGSDDGSRLLIDGKKVVDVDNVHPFQSVTQTLELTKGEHEICVEYFQGFGEAELELDIEGKNLARQQASNLMLPVDRKAKPASSDQKSSFVFDPAKAESGKTWFVKLGCVQCHQLEGVESLRSQSVLSKKWSSLKPDQGCLSANASERPADYQLSPAQAESLKVWCADKQPVAKPTPKDAVHHTLLAFNCYACHARDGIGGPEKDRDQLFVGQNNEIGDEGRIPPPLTGVGDKLNPGYLKQILQEGKKDRPYVMTHMPRYGLENVGHLVDTFAAVDLVKDSARSTLDEPPHRVKAVGRQLVGDKQLSCIKCHVFGERKTSGIAVMDMLVMPKRLREDWFRRYLVDPQKFRPGTRMPASFPNGVAQAKDVYGGSVDHQVTAMWDYLQEGNKASLPDGLVGQVMELIPTKRPIIYRNFIDGLSPRGMAIGYPAGAHVGWDIERLCLGLVWHGRFMDAGRHWQGRGEGKQPPFGDHVIKLESQVPVTVLEQPNAAWPTAKPSEIGYHFLGYQLDADGNPTLDYRGPTFTVHESYVSRAAPKAGGDPFLIRRFAIDEATSDTVWIRAAVGSDIVLKNEAYLIDKTYNLRPLGKHEVTIRKSAGKSELMIKVPVNDRKANVEMELFW